MIRPDTLELVAFLNSLAQIDPIAMGELVSNRVRCNDGLGDHPTVQCGRDSPVSPLRVGMLGIINGWAGVIEEGNFSGWGPISAVMDSDRRCTGFVLTGSLPADRKTLLAPNNPIDGTSAHKPTL